MGSIRRTKFASTVAVATIIIPLQSCKCCGSNMGSIEGSAAAVSVATIIIPLQSCKW